MRSPSETYFDLNNPQQVPSIPYPPFLNYNSFFLILRQFLVIFLRVLLTSLSIRWIFLPLVKVLYFIHLLETLNFLHKLIVDEGLKFLLVHFEEKQLFVWG